MKFPLTQTPYGVVLGEVIEGDLFLHFCYKKQKFSKKDYMTMLDLWSVLLSGIKDTGITEVFSLIAKGDKKVNKFQPMFGLAPYKETEQAVVYRMEL